MQMIEAIYVNMKSVGNINTSKLWISIDIILCNSAYKTDNFYAFYEYKLINSNFIRKLICD